MKKTLGTMGGMGLAAACVWQLIWFLDPVPWWHLVIAFVLGSIGGFLTDVFVGGERWPELKAWRPSGLGRYRRL